MNKIGTRHGTITMYNFIEQHLNTEIKSQQPVQIRQHCSRAKTTNFKRACQLLQYQLFHFGTM